MFKKFIYLLFLSCSVMAEDELTADVLRLVSTDVTPWGFVDKLGKPSGLHVELLQKISAKSGIPTTVVVEPYVRVVRDMQQGTADLSIMFDSPESHEIAHLLTPIEPVNVFLVSREQLSWRALLDKPNLRIGQMGRSNYGIEHFQLKDSHFSPINTVVQGIAMLLRGRLDAVLCTSPAFSLALEELEVLTSVPLKAFHLVEVRAGVFLSKKSTLDKAFFSSIVAEAVKDFVIKKQRLNLNLKGVTFVNIKQERK